MLKSIENQLYLKNFFQFQNKTGTSISKHLNKFNKTFSNLQNLDVEILDKYKVLFLFNLLPGLYECLTIIQLYRNSQIRLEYVSNIMMHNEYRKQGKKVDNELGSDALVARGISESKNQGGHESSPKRSIIKKISAFIIRKGSLL